MEFVNHIQQKNITTYDQLLEYLSGEEFKIRLKTDTKYPDICVCCHDENTNKESSLYGFTNGLIVRKDDLKVLCHSFDKMIEREDYSLDESIDVENAHYEYILEGTLIRVWKYNNELMISTKRCINASRAKWISEKNFRELFMEAMENFNFETIQDGYTYSFLLTHPENNMVVQYSVPKAYHIGTRNMSTLLEENIVLEGVERVPTQQVNKETYEKHIETLKNNEIYGIEGFALVDKNFRRQKFVSVAYAKAKELYGNSNSKMYKFFNLRKDVGQLDEYLKMFPQDSQTFNGFEYNFYQIAIQIHKLYVTKFIRKVKDENGNYVIVPVPYYLKKIVYGLHSDFITHRVQTTLDKVLKKMSEQDVNLQCYIYNKMVNGTQNGHPVTYESIMNDAFLPKPPVEATAEVVLEGVSVETINASNEFDSSIENNE